MKTFYTILGVIAVIGVAAIGYAVVSSGRATATEMVDMEEVTSSRDLVSRAEGVVVGEETSPIKIVEFGDYQCPACGVFSTQIKPRLELEYIKPGKAHLVYYDFPLGQHRHAFLAARAARCAGEQDSFWGYHDALFSRQGEWSARGSATGYMVDLADESGLDAGEFEACLKSDRYADVVTANYMLGERLAIRATPTVIVNNRTIRNPLDYAEITRVIEQELEP